MEELKSLKEYCKSAKKRLKSGFWQQYRSDLKSELDKAKEMGVSESKVKEFYINKVHSGIINSTNEEDEIFYRKVKKLLEDEGEVSNALGRLTDFEVYNKLSYEEKQRYNLNLSEKYLKALERLNKEKIINF
ncbi:MAG: hypothetical protein MJ066_01900 [Clostridia bacterium]|nr:hypothetical protein [Clostridia bacterium]